MERTETCSLEKAASKPETAVAVFVRGDQTNFWHWELQKMLVCSDCLQKVEQQNIRLRVQFFSLPFSFDFKYCYTKICNRVQTTMATNYFRLLKDNSSFSNMLHRYLGCSTWLSTVGAILRRLLWKKQMHIFLQWTWPLKQNCGLIFIERYQQICPWL